MRKWGIIAVVMAVVFICPSAFGATLSYAPQDYYLTIPAGYGQSMPMTVTLDEGEGLGVFSFSFVGDVQGDLPLEWISASPEMAYLSKYWPNTSATLQITVPEGTPLGTYGGYIYARIIASHNPVNVGEGMYVEVYVPAGCVGKPQIEITSFGPDIIRPINSGTKIITISGNIVAPEGCTIYEAGYGIDDEYGEYSGVGTIEVGPDGGSFTAAIEVDSSRDNKDREGRHYTITLYAEDEMGIGVGETLIAVVPHGNSKKNRKEE